MASALTAKVADIEALAQREEGLAEAVQVLGGAVDMGADAKQGLGHVAGRAVDAAGRGDDASPSR
jgi:hypothetical protein